jgi:hypothetical protein
MNDRERAFAHGESDANDVKEAVPVSQLLVFKVSEGWEPLCAFLGVPVPDTPFPNVNDRAEVKKLIRGRRLRRLDHYGGWEFQKHFHLSPGRKWT